MRRHVTEMHVKLLSPIYLEHVSHAPAKMTAQNQPRVVEAEWGWLRGVAHDVLGQELRKPTSCMKDEFQ
jgi:hypothetical protein